MAGKGERVGSQGPEARSLGDSQPKEGEATAHALWADCSLASRAGAGGLHWQVPSPRQNAPQS